jgi:hypothetical protein
VAHAEARVRRGAAEALLALGLLLSPGLVAAVDPEVARLLERAQFWQSRARDDLAGVRARQGLPLAPTSPTR